MNNLWACVYVSLTVLKSFHKQIRTASFCTCIVHTFFFSPRGVLSINLHGCTSVYPRRLNFKNHGNVRNVLRVYKDAVVVYTLETENYGKRVSEMNLLPGH